MKLSDINTGDTVYIKTLLMRSGLKRRLMDVGFTCGTEIQCISESILGDPRAYLVKDALIAIRNKDAENVLVDYSI